MALAPGTRLGPYGFIREFSCKLCGLIRVLCLVCAPAILLACEEVRSQDGGSEAPQTDASGFEAVITGSYEGAVSGSGVLRLLPDAGFENQGYWFLADGQGIRAHGVTFVLPRTVARGRHTLESPSALDIGTVPSVRVDRDMGDSTVSSDRNTSGFLDLTAFPDDERNVRGADVTGTFVLETDNPSGDTIQVEGRFSFQAD